MIPIAIFLGIWSVVALSIILLVGRYLGRRPRSLYSLVAATPPAPREGDAHPGGEIRGTAASYPRSGAPQSTCGWWVGPVWKLDGETCVCCLDRGHRLPHKCTCGATFEGCGHPPVGEVQR